MFVLIWTAIKVLTDLHSHSRNIHHFLCKDHTCTHANIHAHTLTIPLNTQHHLVVPKSAGVFPHGASKRQGLRDQRLLRLCFSARLHSTLMQMCARQSGSEDRQAGRQAGVHDWVTIDPPTIHICGNLHSGCRALSVYQSLCLFLTLGILHNTFPVFATLSDVCFSLWHVL